MADRTDERSVGTPALGFQWPHMFQGDGKFFSMWLDTVQANTDAWVNLQKMAVRNVEQFLDSSHKFAKENLNSSLELVHLIVETTMAQMRRARNRA